MFVVEMLLETQYIVLTVRLKWVRKKCDIKGSMIKVSKPCVCRGCPDQTAITDSTSMDIGDGASLELIISVTTVAC